MPFSTYLPERMGSIKLSPAGPFVAGSFAELTLVYTAGTFGIDDTGMMKISWRTTSDMSKPQFDKPQTANFTTVEASNGAKLEVMYNGTTTYTPGSTVVSGSHHQGLTVVMFHDGELGSEQAPSARDLLGPEWQDKGIKDRHSCPMLELDRLARLRSSALSHLYNSPGL